MGPASGTTPFAFAQASLNMGQLIFALQCLRASNQNNLLAFGLKSGLSFICVLRNSKQHSNFSVGVNFRLFEVGNSTLFSRTCSARPATGPNRTARQRTT